jgi:hypothetical protein
MRTTRTLTRWPLVFTLLALFTSAALAQLAAPPQDIEISDQKAGSVLVFPYYTSDGVGPADTSITISHAGGAGSVNVHLFFVDGSNCGIADAGVVLTPHGSIEFTTSSFDPMITGYLIAVAVGDNGCPVEQNVLIGHAFVKAPAGYIAPGAGQVRGDYGAEAIRANPNGNCPFPANCTSGLLPFDGTHYEALPTSFVAQIQSPVSVPGQTIVLASLQGDGGVMNPTGQFGTGYIFDANERPYSFTGFLRASCHSITPITATAPRVPFGMSKAIKPGTVGLIKFSTRVGSVGLLFTPDNASGFFGIRTLHKYATSASTTLTIPVF